MPSTNVSTFEYSETEARLEASEIRMGDRPHPRMPSIVRNGGFHPLPMASLTPEQARHAAWSLYGCLLDLHNVLAERGEVNDMIISASWGRARAAVRHASEWTPPAVGEGGESSASSGSEAGDGQIHRSTSPIPPVAG